MIEAALDDGTVPARDDCETDEWTEATAIMIIIDYLRSGPFSFSFWTGISELETVLIVDWMSALPAGGYIKRREKGRQHTVLVRANAEQAFLPLKHPWERRYTCLQHAQTAFSSLSPDTQGATVSWSCHILANDIINTGHGDTVTSVQSSLESTLQSLPGTKRACSPRRSTLHRILRRLNPTQALDISQRGEELYISRWSWCKSCGGCFLPVLRLGHTYRDTRWAF